MVAGFRIQLASRLKKAAIDLYDFVENPTTHDLGVYLTTVAHLVDASATEAETEITGMRRTVGGLTAKIAKLESELALTRARLDKLQNDMSPISGMKAGYDS